jgi:hypothetical protein
MSILTRLAGYRPNFCAECGNKIVRLRWFAWTSRSFCDTCARTFARSHWLRPSLLLLALGTCGVLVGRGCRRVPPPLIIERPASGPAQNSIAPTPPRESNTPQPATANEEVYMCGARTKKGTPCSRRVHGPVRCWQHKGTPAMLPQEKLRIKD